MGFLRFFPLLCLVFGGCQGRDTSRRAAPASRDAGAASQAPIDSHLASSVTVSYPMADGDGATLFNFSGIALDETRVLTVIPQQIPPNVGAPTIWFEDRTSPGRSWNFDTVPDKEILLPEIGMKVVTCEKPLPGAAALARKSDAQVGAGIYVVGTYADGLDAMVMRGSVAKLGGPPNDEDAFLIDASLTGSSAGAGVYDERLALIGIVVSPYIVRHLGIHDTRVGHVIKIEAVARALQEKGVAFRSTP